MFSWAKNAVGLTEPIYGPSAIHSVADQTPSSTEVQKADLAWEVMDTTNVETKTFYMTSDSGHLGLVQIIYSNVLGVRTTAQFNSKVYYPREGEGNGKEHLWASDNLASFEFSKDKQGFVTKSGDVRMELSEDGRSYVVKSTINKGSVVDLRFTQASPGFMAGKNGTTTYGTDAAKPWGRMKHLFWPRCKVEGSILTQAGPVDFTGRGVFIHALQGMKPHFAAARWNFANFQSPSYSAILMQFTTPPSYGESVVAVGCIAEDGKILFGGASPGVSATHTEVKGDPDNEWPEPGKVKFEWKGEGCEAVLEGGILPRVDRVDVMGELPKFVKQIATQASGTKPYIYQYTPKLTLEINGKKEEGQLFMEATFIS
ncbi:hypothetical protein LTR62_007644 [Meristemomyces frigidus]|uniref:Survival factor 1 n=1 Tax=Meristemomyces frigidus TaxID=1508187 RepID=A0AAN7TIS8_9PEZI|nr:hypothetical protein LTR62_007644 [Meristemomyces frigidus]